ncbi:F0F1 ATP synthase subunit I [Dickeya fangzhongdai]|uniref:F0F1 ATP synthase subunit I n=1 Tax=Dickeya fangzhongdai TaxID=1778540 RepID=UPI0004F8031B|nr:F0F1 ATP synthase subunit I [Dickeya fangzhongdai]AIR70008.1 ATP synthase F0F1 subunit I [Dickeya fangzhongdai]KGT97617.1 ATP synthase F0F1 subunit I [Dickeya fangzhongdai]KHN60605.1 ATP synthase F0F1 subunit I [Dickeya fangzhongdai]WPD74137.1 F0F1 ATP synthase subunit I [Dickeya fangzhongdai]
MSVSLYSGKIARLSLLLQLTVILVVSAAFCVGGVKAGASALAGGLAAWLPNMVFILFAVRHQTDKPPEGRVAWSFAVGEALKMLFTIVLLVVALGVFHAAFFPLGLTYLVVLITQIVAPAVINRYRS